MPARFEIVTVRHGDAARSAQRIICQCGATDDFVQSAARKLPHEAAEQAFRNRGWVVGSRRGRDVCPACVAARQAAHKERKTMKEAVQVVVEPPRAEPPREMTRDHKRIINLKLHEVWLDERTGYAPGWSDRRVAEDLGVPWKWVSDVRDELFGPDRAAEEIEALTAEVRALRYEAAVAVRHAAELTEKIDKARAEYEREVDKLKTLVKKVNGLSDRLTALQRGA